MAAETVAALALLAAGLLMITTRDRQERFFTRLKANGATGPGITDSLGLGLMGAGMVALAILFLLPLG